MQSLCTDHRPMVL